MTNHKTFKYFVLGVYKNSLYLYLYTRGVLFKFFIVVTL